MKCPVCSESALVMTARQGIEIDYCPQCRGVWLDRGELDKIIERSMAETAAAPWPGPQPGVQSRPGDCDDDRYRSGYYPQKRRGFLKDVFD
jgi:Zn-finger nucleic acid-binding protein